MSDSSSGAAIYQNANRPSVAPQNPLDIYQQMGQLTQTRNAIAAFQAKRLQGQAFQNALNPDGTINQAAYNQALRALGPDGAIGVQEASQQGQTNQGDQQSQALRTLTAQNTALDSLSGLNGGAGPTYEQLRGKLTEGIAGGWLTPQSAHAVLLGMPEGDDPASMAHRQQSLQVMGRQTMSAAERLQANTGANGTATAPGGVQIGTKQDPYTGAVSAPPQAGVQTQGLSPADLATQVDGPAGPDGQPTKITLQQRLQSQGVWLPGMPGYNAAPTGGLPAGLRRPGAAAAPQAAPQGGMSGGRAVPAGQGPAQAAAQAQTGSDAAKAFQAISDQGTQARTRGAVLDNMLSDTSQFTSGPLSGIKEKVRALGTQFSLPVDTDKLTASESFNKLAANLASQQGAGSDARLSVAQSGNPHADLSPAGVDLMLRQLRGNEDYLQARQTLAGQYPNQADSRGFENEVGKTLDPRTFQYDRMTDPQKRTYFNAMSKKDQAAFITAHDKAAALLGARQ